MPAAAILALMSAMIKCKWCTFDNDVGATHCAVCANALSVPQPSLSQAGASSGDLVCGWPLNNGSTCTYEAPQLQTLTRHRRELSGHSQYRASQDATESRQQSRLETMFKRARPDEGHTSAAAASSTRGNATSSTRSQPPPSSTFAQYAYQPPAQPPPPPPPAPQAPPPAEPQTGARLEEEMQQQQQQQQQEMIESITRIAAEAASHSLAGQISTLTQQLRDLPATLTRGIPAAVRDYDEREAARIAKEGGDTPFQHQIAACLTCAEIGKLPGFTFNSTENHLTCDDCFRYASSKHVPSLLRRGRETGLFKGTDETRKNPGKPAGPSNQKRPFKTIRWEVKHHCRTGSLHEWCAAHASEQRKEQAIANKTAMACARLVYIGIKEHNSYRSYERAIANQYAIGTQVGTKNHSREVKLQYPTPIHPPTNFSCHGAQFSRGFATSIYTTTVASMTKALTTIDTHGQVQVAGS